MVSTGMQNGVHWNVEECQLEGTRMVSTKRQNLLKQNFTGQSNQYNFRNIRPAGLSTLAL